MPNQTRFGPLVSPRANSSIPSLDPSAQSQIQLLSTFQKVYKTTSWSGSVIRSDIVPP